MAMEREYASCVCDLIEEATSKNWPGIAAAMLERGYTPRQIEAAVGWLTETAHRMPIIEAGDFR